MMSSTFGAARLRRRGRRARLPPFDHAGAVDFNSAIAG